MMARLTPSMTALMRVPVPDLSSRLHPGAVDCGDLSGGLAEQRVSAMGF